LGRCIVDEAAEGPDDTGQCRHSRKEATEE
jgi:hypothetical protein